MNLRDFGLLTDENIDAAVVKWLQAEGWNVLDVLTAGLGGASDVELLHRANAENRIVVTHDADFGTLAIFQAEPLVGLIYVRPGHIDATYTTEMLSSLFAANPQVTPPFVVVARRTGQEITIRIRHLTK